MNQTAPTNQPNARQGTPRRHAKINEWLSQARAYYGQNYYEKAIELCQRVLLRSPQHQLALTIMGATLYSKREFDKAEQYLRGALQVQKDVVGHLSLALTLVELGKVQEAIYHYRCGLEIDPQRDHAWNELGNLLVKGNDPRGIQEAKACYKKAISLNEKNLSAHCNLGFAYEQQQKWIKAEAQYRYTLAGDPNFTPALSNLGNLLQQDRRLEEAYAYYEKAFTCEPQNMKFKGQLLSARYYLCEWTTQEPTMQSFMQNISDDASYRMSPLIMLAAPEIDAAQQRQMGKSYAQNTWKTELQQPALVERATPLKNRRMRVAYLSADFRDHPVANLVSDVLIAHDKTKVELFLYAYGVPEMTAQQQRLQQHAEHYIDINGISDADAAQRIQKDEIDVLVDLTGYTSQARMGITARRPAGIVVSWLGYVASLGEERLADYIVGDATVTPAESAHLYSETIVQMPLCFQPNRRLTQPLNAPTRTQAGLPENAVVFCSFNQSFKYNAPLWDDWCAILALVPDSVLWVARGRTLRTEANLRRETERRGIAVNRLIFADQLPLAEHQARICLADLALDAFPYNSGTTGSDALRAGVPMMTCMGEAYASRMGASLLHALDMDELITTTRPDYCALAIALGNDKKCLQRIREKLKNNIASSSLFQPERFAQNLEKAYRAMHEQALSSERKLITVT